MQRLKFSRAACGQNETDNSYPRRNTAHDSAGDYTLYVPGNHIPIGIPTHFSTKVVTSWSLFYPEKCFLQRQVGEVGNPLNIAFQSAFEYFLRCTSIISNVVTKRQENKGALVKLT